MSANNFEFINQLYGINSLYKFCREAEAYAICNPDISITAARKSMEFIVKLLYRSAINSEIDGLSLFDMLSYPDFIKYLDDQMLLDSFHFVRKNGNQAVHQGNMTKEMAIKVLEQLHFMVGEVCVFLGLVDSYPIFNGEIENKQMATPSPTEIDEPQVESAMIRFFSPRLHSVRHYSELRKITNVHIDPRRLNNHNSKARIPKVDSGANTKTAFYLVTEWLAEKLGESKMAADYSKQVFSFIINMQTITLAVKTGCSVLGYKSFDGQWDILPGINYILYAPDVSDEIRVIDQLRVFTRDEFLEMWEALDLIRYKVSTATTKRTKQLYGDDYKISVDRFADVASVQSFSNSRVKKAAVLDYCNRFPIISKVGFTKIMTT